MFFESPTANIDIDNYESTTKKIFNILFEAEYNIYIKPHPSKGYSKFLNELKINIWDQNLPGELIDIGKFDFAFGINSLSIARLSIDYNDKLYSLIGLYRFKDDKNKLLGINNLKIQSQNNINFIKSFDNLYQMLLNN